jgi:hypothetical protein
VVYITGTWSCSIDDYPRVVYYATISAYTCIYKRDRHLFYSLSFRALFVLLNSCNMAKTNIAQLPIHWSFEKNVMLTLRWYLFLITVIFAVTISPISMSLSTNGKMKIYNQNQKWTIILVFQWNIKYWNCEFHTLKSNESEWIMRKTNKKNKIHSNFLSLMVTLLTFTSGALWGLNNR